MNEPAPAVGALAATAPEREALVAADRAHLWHPWSPSSAWAGDQLVLASGSGCTVTDVDGRSYIDARSGALNASCGYNHPDVLAAVSSQAAALMSADLSEASNVPAILLARRYAELLPDPLTRTFFCSSGSEATETAIKIARMYHALCGRPSRRTIVSLRDGYHGTTLGALAASPLVLNQFGNDPLPEGFRAIATPRCPRCATHVEHDACSVPSANELAELIEREGRGTVAAFVVEPILGIAGVVVPPPGYLRRIREICDAYGVLLVVDETMTGFGRTGGMFGF